MKLEGESFTKLAYDFKKKEKELERGLKLIEFIEIVLKHIPKSSTTEELMKTISDLIDLFIDIDINGDKTLEFQEFTSYCVDAGMVATRVCSKPLSHHYVKRKKQKIIFHKVVVYYVLNGFQNYKNYI